MTKKLFQNINFELPVFYQLFDSNAFSKVLKTQGLSESETISESQPRTEYKTNGIVRGENKKEQEGERDIESRSRREKE